MIRQFPPTTTLRLLYAAPLLVLAACSEPRAAAPPAAPAANPIAVKVVAATTQDWPRFYETTGTVRTRSTTVVAAKWMGYVREVKVRVGDHVRPGQLLVALDTRDLDASSNRAVAARDEVRSAMPEADGAIAAAKANLDLVQVTFRRMNELYQKKSISDQEFDEASAKLKAAQAGYDMARARRLQLDAKLAQANQEVAATQVTRSYAEVLSPVAGVVTMKSVDTGNLAVPGTPLLTLESETYRLEAAVEESRLGAIRAGQKVTVSLDSFGKSFETRVSEIVPAVDAASRAFTVKIDLPPTPNLRSGVFGRARFALGTRTVLAIPSGSIAEHGQLQSVFVAGEGVARTRLVTTGERPPVDSLVEVLSGLNPRENVIVPVPAGLLDGSKIEVKP